MPTTVHILLFRGVGGATQLPVKALRERLLEAGFVRVATYINSGNAVVASEWSRDEVLAKVARICQKLFAFEKAIFAATREEWSRLMADNPFPEGVEPGKFLHAALLERRPPKEKVEALAQVAAAGRDEGFAVVGKVAYLHTPHGFAVSSIAKRFDKGIGVVNTARNWNTVRKLADLAAAVERGEGDLS